MQKLTLISLLSLTLGTLACGGGATGAGHDCPSACMAAQAANCTAIRGDCNSFCASVDAISAQGNCNNYRDAYQNCIITHPVCTADANCGAQKQALGSCALTFCQANPGNTDCTNVSGSL